MIHKPVSSGFPHEISNNMLSKSRKKTLLSFLEMTEKKKRKALRDVLKAQ